VIIILIARWRVRVVNVAFKEISEGKLSFRRLEREAKEASVAGAMRPHDAVNTGPSIGTNLEE
jgi:hypothetical protein